MRPLGRAMTDCEWIELNAFLYAATAVFGLILGSFGNVLIWRVPRGESVAFPGSHCPSCGSAIAWHDNIPVLSWVVLGGKCRSCRAPISLRYPLVELASGALWVLAAVAFGFTPTGLAAAIFFYVLLILTFIDWDTMRLPNPIVGTLFGVGLVGAVVSQLAHFDMVPLVPTSGRGFLGQPLVSALIGALLSAGVAALIAGAYAGVRGAQGFGVGDVKLLGAMGIFIGPLGLLALFLGSIFGSVYGLVLSAMTKKPLKEIKFPFGPFLAIGGLLVALYGPLMWSAYVGSMS